MNNRSLIVAASVLAVLLGTLYWSNRHKPEANENSNTSTAESSPKILTLEEGNISRIAIRKRDAEEVVLIRDGDKWRITAPKELGVDQEAVSSMLSAVSSLSSERLIDDKGDNPGRYGLSEPGVEVTITEKDNKKHKL